ncbi:hypothetical protein HZS_8096 [Henneguya salminicola]|nr:hypothetical protein HZS_8096 [Henneguya salminicola]
MEYYIRDGPKYLEMKKTKIALLYILYEVGFISLAVALVKLEARSLDTYNIFMLIIMIAVMTTVGNGLGILFLKVEQIPRYYLTAFYCWSGSIFLSALIISYSVLLLVKSERNPCVIYPKYQNDYSNCSKHYYSILIISLIYMVPTIIYMIKFIIFWIRDIKRAPKTHKNFSQYMDRKFLIDENNLDDIETNSAVII